MNHSVFGRMALEGESHIIQIFVTSHDSPEVLKRKLYVITKTVDNAAIDSRGRGLTSSIYAAYPPGA